MSYKKIIPCLDLENALEMAKFYNDAGADEIAYFDSKATKEGREANIAVIKEICKNVDIPLIACGGVRRLEDIKKMLYAGASKVCMKSAALNTPELVTEAADRFGSERIIVTIDLSEYELLYSQVNGVRAYVGAGDVTTMVIWDYGDRGFVLEGWENVKNMLEVAQSVAIVEGG